MYTDAMDQNKKTIDLSKMPVKDSGDRQQFKTGAVRDSEHGKGRYDLISPIALRRLAIHLEKGAIKYDEWNWSKGMNMGRTFDSLIRHIFQYLGGDRSEDHIGAILCNAMFIAHYEEAIKTGSLPKELDDLKDFYNGSEENWTENLNSNK